MLLTSYCQTPVQSPDFSLGLGVDFVLPLSQQQEQEQEQEQQEPHQNIPEGKVQNVLNFAKSHAKANQTHATPLPTLILSPPKPPNPNPNHIPQH